MKKAIYLLLTVVVLISLVLIAGPGTFKSKTYRQVKGKVSSIYNHGNKDLILKLEASKICFCIPGILIDKQQVEQYKSSLVGKNVMVQYCDAWTPFDPACSKQVSELKLEETILYSSIPK